MPPLLCKGNLNMKRMIKASDTSEKIRWKLEKPSLRSYEFVGTAFYDGVVGLQGHITKISPYDDADYAWAKVHRNGLIEFILNGKIVDKLQMHAYEEEDYEDIQEYFNDTIESGAEELKNINKDIKPRMMYN